MTLFERLQEGTGVKLGPALVSVAMFPFYGVAWVVGFIGRLLRLLLGSIVLGFRDGWGSQ